MKSAIMHSDTEFLLDIKKRKQQLRTVSSRIFIFSRRLFLFILLLLPIYASAQLPSGNDQQSDPSKEQQADESDAAEDQSAEGMDLGLGELIDTALLSEGWAKSLNETLDKYGLSSSSVGKAVATAVVILVFLLIYFVLKKIAHKLLLKIKHANNPIQMSFKRTNLYLSILNTLIFLLLTCLLVMVLTGIWNSDAGSSFVFRKSSAVFQFIATFAFLSILGALAFEAVSAVMERVFSRWSDHGSARIQTLLPIARNVVNFALFIILGITLISELGINVMPLLAGAGVIGFAIGFGAQTIIKDLINGFIIIFEDLVQVGDVVTVGGKSGLVEKITIRKIQLRGLDGTVTTVPFSEITIVENMTKEFSYYLMNVGVAYRESTDEVVELLKSIGEELQNDEQFKDLIIEPIEILGVDAFADSAVIIKARIKTLPIKQWFVGREFNRRMKYRFDEAGIEIPFPHQTVYFGEGKSGEAPPARIKIDRVESANDSDGSINTKKNLNHDAKDLGGYIEDEPGNN